MRETKSVTVGGINPRRHNYPSTGLITTKAVPRTTTRPSSRDGSIVVSDSERTRNVSETSWRDPIDGRLTSLRFDDLIHDQVEKLVVPFQ